MYIDVFSYQDVGSPSGTKIQLPCISVTGVFLAEDQECVGRVPEAGSQVWAIARLPSITDLLPSVECHVGWRPSQGICF